jgi:hypothetical protein
MASPLETVVLDSAGVSPLTIQSGTVYHLDALDPGLAARRPTWATGVEADGGVLVVDPPYDDAVMTASVQIVPATDTKDAALAALNALTLKLQECSASGPDGLACTYTPANASTTYTFYVKLAEYDGAPPLDPRTAEGYMTLNNQPVVKLKLTRRPFFYAPEIATVTDDFSTNTIGNYTFDVGSGTISVSGGVLVPSATGEKRFCRNLGGYDAAGKFYDVQVGLKHATGSPVATHNSGVIAKHVDGNNMLFSTVFDDGSSRSLTVSKIDGGIASTLTSVTITGGLSANASYWHRFRVEGNLLTAELWTSAPTATGTPAFTVPYTLAGADATKFGAGVGGQVGIRVSSTNTNARYDDFTVEPNVAVSSTPLLTLSLPGVPGEADAEARLIVTDRANKGRRFVEWGQQQRNYQGLGLEIDSLVTTNFAGTSTTRTGSYNTNVTRATLTQTSVVVCSTGALGHIGTFRVWARAYPTSGDVTVRLSWQEGSGRLRANDYATPPTYNAWVDLDLGVVSIGPALSGTQQWLGQIEALADTVGATIDIDYVLLVPTDAGYAKALFSPPFESIRTFSARDEFDQSAGNLNGKTAPVGGTWATSGAATGDFAVESTGHTVQRATANDGQLRFAILGSTSLGATLVQADVAVDGNSGGLVQLSNGPALFLIARYVDSSNYLRASIDPLGDGRARLDILRWVSGSSAAVSSAIVTMVPHVAYRARLVVDAAGRVNMWFGTNISGPPLLGGQDDGLAAGGAIASGKYGLGDVCGSYSGVTRTYDNFVAAVPFVDEIIGVGRDAQFRSDGAIRTDPAGTNYGPVTVRGGNFKVPPAGAENRTARVALRAARVNVEDTPNTNVTDKLQAQVALTPRYLQPK